MHMLRLHHYAAPLHQGNKFKKVKKGGLHHLILE
jgi:hypothetical protein